MNDFALIVNAIKYGGWTSLSVGMGLDQLAHTFDVSLTDKWSDQKERVPIVAGSEVLVTYGQKTIITGYVDDDSSNYSASGRSLSINGRSKTSDLVDCAAIRANKKRSWRKASLAKIANDICGPFGISATVNPSPIKTFNRYTIEEGETAFATLQRAARMRGLLLQTDSSGNVVFDRVGTSKVTTVLKLGDNIISGSHSRSMRNRFSEYIIKCQTTGSDETAETPKTITIKRSSEDEGVARYRPTVVMADNEDQGSELQTRADWERNVRAGESRVFTYTVRGWEHTAGLWEPNKLVRVIDDWNWLDAELLISEVSFTRGGSGTLTTLTLKAPEAYDVQPLFPPAKPPAQKKKDNILASWLAGQPETVEGSGL